MTKTYQVVFKAGHEVNGDSPEEALQVAKNELAFEIADSGIIHFVHDIQELGETAKLPLIDEAVNDIWGDRYNNERFILEVLRLHVETWPENELKDFLGIGPEDEE